MIDKDEGEGATHTHDFEKSGVLIRLPEQEAESFWRCTDNREINIYV